MNILLCGMMGVGKTTVGKALAETLGLRFVDTDGEIERAHGKISELFAVKGEEYFRALETETVKGLIGQDGLVVATGGGLVIREENRRLLKNFGLSVYLRARVETLEKRLLDDCTRPLLQGEEVVRKERLRTLLAERGAKYKEFADCIVEVDEKSIAEIVSEIIERAEGAGAR